MLRLGSRGFKRLRFVINSDPVSSTHARKYLRANLASLENSLGQGNVLVRECQGVEELLVAEFDYGVEHKRELRGYNDKEISEIVEGLKADAKRINNVL